MTTHPPLDADRQRLVMNWVRLSRKRAWEAARRHYAIPYDELLSAAYAGLVKAASLFDPFRGFSFSTYADPSIRRSIWRAISRHYRDAGLFHGFGVDPESGAGLESLVEDHRQDAPDVPEEHRDQWAEAQRRMERCLRERERKSVQLHFLAGQSFDVVGPQVGLSMTGCCSACAAAVEALRANRSVRIDDVELGPEACFRRRLAQETA